MGISVGDNFDYRGKKPNFTRDQFETLQEMRDYPTDNIDEGHISYVLEDGKHYVYKTGEWVPLNVGGTEGGTSVEITQTTGQNTAAVMSQKAVTDMITEYNVSKLHPTGGISGTDKYTLETAIAKIPAELRYAGIKCSFLNEREKFETYEYQGGTFSSVASWITGSTPVVYDLTSAVPTGGLNGGDTYDIATAVKSVAGSLQMFIRYLTFKNATGGRELWQFNGIRTASLSEWGKLEKWVKLNPTMYHSLEWTGLANTTRTKVPLFERMGGMIIHYNTGTEDVYELYKGENYAANDASYYNNFVRLLDAGQVNSIVKQAVKPVIAEGDYQNAFKEIYLEKYEAEKKYKIGHIAIGHGYPTGLIWITYEGAPNNYAVLQKNSNCGINGEIFEVESVDKKFKAYLRIDWSKIPNNTNEDINLVILDASKVMDNSPTIYSMLKLKPVAHDASVGVGLKSRLYNEKESITFEDIEEQEGDALYTYNDIGLVHKAKKNEKFNTIKLGLNKQSHLAASEGSLVVKKGTVISASGGEIIKQIDGFKSTTLPGSGIFEIKLDKDVTLSEGEYLWVYYTGNQITLRVWNANNEGGTRCGMYFQGSLNTYKYSTEFTLSNSKGDLIEIQERLSTVESELGIEGGNSKITSPLITLPGHLYVATGREQTFFYNEFILGIESNIDNTLLNYNIGTKISPAKVGNKCVASKEGFTIYTKTAGEYTLTVSVYDQFNNLIVSKDCKLRTFDAKPLENKSILMLGDSWTDINNGSKGYTPYLDKALKEMGITMKFIGTRDAGTSGLKHEGIGGYAWDTFVTAPLASRYKFYVDNMPSISTSDIYSNNGSTYKLFEKGSGYITMSRVSGNTEPSGNTLTRTEGTGDASITFTKWNISAGNPLWNIATAKVDFTHYRRDLCGLPTPLDYCNIQLGVNDCIGGLKTSTAEWKKTLDAVSKLLDAILEDSPNCKIIVNLVGLDAPSPTAWSSLSGLVDSKRDYQLSCYHLRKFINDLIAQRSDYNKNVFIGQSVLGINRWCGYGYIDKRYRFFKVDTDKMTSEDLTKVRDFNYQEKSVWIYTDDRKEYQVHFYDSRGYLVCIAQQDFLNWDKHEQEFVNEFSQPDNNTPKAGNLTKGGGSSSLDYPVVPYTDCYIENNNNKEHWFMNATHPYALGYKQMAYCVAHQIAALML